VNVEDDYHEEGDDSFDPGSDLSDLLDSQPAVPVSVKS
jgi:hypothetical protein